MTPTQKRWLRRGLVLGATLVAASLLGSVGLAGWAIGLGTVGVCQLLRAAARQDRRERAQEREIRAKVEDWLKGVLRREDP